MNAGSSAHVELADVSFSYGRQPVLVDVSVRIDAGVTFLVGRNGAGKTTLFKLLMGALLPSRGSLSIDGRAVTRKSRSDVLRRIGYLPQDFDYPRQMRLNDFVGYLAWLRGMRSAGIGAAVASALEAVGLSEVADRPLGTLSGGMVRRAGIAQAIVHGPALLLLDEPASGLDPGHRVELRRLIRELGATIPVICSTHILEDAALLDCELIAVADGQILYQGPTVQLLKPAAGAGGELPGPQAGSDLSPMEAAFLRLTGQSVTASEESATS